MNFLKRSPCIVCKKKKYIKFMLPTKIDNFKSDTTYCCNKKECIGKLKYSITKEVNYHENKIRDLKKLFSDIEKEEIKNINQLTIEP